MLHTNLEFYRSSRESAFVLNLTFAQIELLLLLYRTMMDARQRRELYLKDGSDPTKYAVWEDFVETGDGTDCAGYGAWHRATVRCLLDKGLIASKGRIPHFTQAGWLTLQLLQVSGHIQELTWATKATQEVCHADAN